MLQLADDPHVGAKTLLHSCAIGDVKNVDILNDLPCLLRSEGFLDCEAKSVGGFRFLLESHSREALNKILSDGQEKLSQWFNWLSPWNKASETTRPGRLV